MSYINRKHARQSGTNRTTQAEISNRFWLSFPGRVTKPRNSSYQLVEFSGAGQQQGWHFTKPATAGNKEIVKITEGKRHVRQRAVLRSGETAVLYRNQVCRGSLVLNMIMSFIKVALGHKG